MLKRIPILFVICLAAFGASAQIEKYTAPVKWERYAVSDRNVSILFPKLPTLIRQSDDCTQRNLDQYVAYADGAVYGLTILSKSKKNVSGLEFICPQIGFFIEEQFKGRLEYIRNRLKSFDETKINQNGKELIKIKSTSEPFTYWLISDSKNKKIYEFWVAGKGDEHQEVKNFVESLNINETMSKGIEIGEGAKRTLGDEGIDDTAEIEPQDKSIDGVINKYIEKYRIFFKPRADYTNKAREKKTTGTVKLKVSLSANGGIKSITAENELKNGLTEEAIAAAKKIVFIPTRKNGKFITEIVTVEYSFNIY